MTADQVYDARDRFPGPDVPMPIPMDPHDVIELARLRTIERELTRPVLDLLVELAYLRIVAREAEIVAAKVAEHERRGYQHIRIGVFEGVRRALGKR